MDVQLDEQIITEVSVSLREQQEAWQKRLKAIQSDRRRKTAPLDPDFAEQAVQRENDEALDALDARGREELTAIDAALARIAAGTFGRCVACGEPVAERRIRALPTAAACAECAVGASHD